MHRRKINCLPILIGVIGLMSSGPSLAQSSLKDQLGPERPLPPASTRIDYDPSKKLSTVNLQPKNILKDPQTLVRFLKANPDRLSIDAMNPALVLTIARILVEGDALFLAERLLFMATEKWSDRPDLSREHARMLIQLGRSSAASRILKKTVGLEPENVTGHFLYAFATVRRKPMLAEHRKLAIKHFQIVLKLDPDFVDQSGWTTSNIRNQLDRMTKALNADVGMPSAP